MIDVTSEDYKSRINRVVDYILSNLHKPLSVEELSGQASLSSYHFHRIFTAMTGEPLAKYVMRKRLERSAALLVSDMKSPVMNIALECGFNSANVFCRNFKRHFGLTPGEYRSKKGLSNSKNRQFESINDPKNRSYSRYFCCHKTLIIGEKTMNCTFEIKKMPAFHVIYCRHQGAFDQMQEAFVKLMQWAYPRGLVAAPEMKLLSVYHDDPEITEKDKLTSDAGMIVAGKVKTDGEIGQYEISGGLYAVGRFEVAMEEFPAAWNAMFGLLKEHGCQCTDGYHYEVYQNNRDEHPEKKWIVDICIPVKVL